MENVYTKPQEFLIVTLKSEVKMERILYRFRAKREHINDHLVQAPRKWKKIPEAKRKD